MPRRLKAQLPDLAPPEDMSVESRISMLELYIQAYDDQGISPTQQTLMDCIKKSGWTAYNRTTLWHDRRRLAKGSNFVRDLAASNYSTYIEQCYETLDDLEDKAYDLFNDKWKVRTVKTRTWEEDGEIKSSEESTVQDVPYQVKLESLKLIQKSVDLKTRIVGGENLQLSAAMLADKFRKLDEENKNLRKMLGKNAVLVDKNVGDNADLR